MAHFSFRINKGIFGHPSGKGSLGLVRTSRRTTNRVAALDRKVGVFAHPLEKVD